MLSKKLVLALMAQGVFANNDSDNSTSTDSYSGDPNSTSTDSYSGDPNSTSTGGCSGDACNAPNTTAPPEKVTSPQPEKEKETEAPLLGNSSIVSEEEEETPAEVTSSIGATSEATFAVPPETLTSCKMGGLTEVIVGGGSMVSTVDLVKENVAAAEAAATEAPAAATEAPAAAADAAAAARRLQDATINICDADTLSPSEDEDLCIYSSGRPESAELTGTDDLVLHPQTSLTDITGCAAASAAGRRARNRRLSESDITISHTTNIAFKEEAGTTDSSFSAAVTAMNAETGGIEAATFLTNMKAVMTAIEDGTGTAALGVTFATKAAASATDFNPAVLKAAVGGDEFLASAEFKSMKNHTHSMTAADIEVKTTVEYTQGTTTSGATAMAASAFAFIGAALLF